jgi:ubiquinone/menaquinone biosynthesis C-methylase UbiE
VKPPGGRPPRDAEGDRRSGSRHHREIVQSSFEKQAEDFSRSPVITDAAALARLIHWSAVTGQERVLDAACGPGLVAAALAPRARWVVGVDVTPAMIARGREIAAERGARNVAFVLGDVEALPFAAAVFDRVLCRRSFHHFPDPAAVLAEMARVCGPGGAVVIEDQAPPPDPEAAETMMAIDKLRDPSHAGAVAPSAWEALFQQCGLALEKIDLSPREMDADEWMRRAHPAPENAARARALLEASARGEIRGPRARWEGGALRFSIAIQRVRGVKP